MSYTLHLPEAQPRKGNFPEDAHAMKLVCDRSALLDALTLAGSVVASRTPASVLLCLKFAAKNGILTISATDTEVGLSVPVASVSVTDEGEALIQADKLNQIVRASEDSTLAIEVKNNIAVIKGQDSTFKIFGYDPKYFPGLHAFDPNRS